MDRQIAVFYHIACMNHWRDVVMEHTRKLVQSNLYRNAHKIFYSVIGTKEEYEELAESIAVVYPKIELAYHGSDIKQYEFPTLQLLYEHAQNNDADIYYFHTKGVSYKNTHMIFYISERWRKYMDFFLLENWKHCHSKLQDHDVCSIGKVCVDGKLLWFAGNFWWVKSEYIRTCPDPKTLDHTNRWDAEKWLGYSSAPLNSFSWDDRYNNPETYNNMTDFDWQGVINSRLRCSEDSPSQHPSD